jgi:uncharacterized pyridoxal phosphate-dependent enzyme
MPDTHVVQQALSLHEKYLLTPVINAAGSFTPLGVSRSPEPVRQAVAAALGEFFVIDELQEAVSRTVARQTGAEAAAVVHCVAAGITVAVAAAMAGRRPESVAALPDAQGLAHRVVLPAGHAVDYGHPILTDIRLAGASPVLAGTPKSCSVDDLHAALAHEKTAALLLVSSRLTSGKPVDLTAAVAAARDRGVPAIIDGAAQDLRVDELLATGADLVLLSAHKYLASPTAGLIIGRRERVLDCRAQEKGIGRAMKPSKEALVGVLAALAEREQLDLTAWRDEQARKVESFIERARRIPRLEAQAVPDPAGMPFSRVRLSVHGGAPHATELVRHLKEGRPSIRVMEHELAQGHLLLELVPLREEEYACILDRLTQALP